MGNNDREATLIIIDISITMNNIKKELALKSIENILQNKLFFNKRDEISIVLIGTEKTLNQLNENGNEENYSNITIYSYFQLLKLQFILDLKNILNISTHGKSKADIIDAFIISLDLLYRHTNDKSFPKKQILLLTDFETRVHDAKDLVYVIEMMKNMECRLNIITIGSNESEMKIIQQDPYLSSSNSSSSSPSSTSTVAQENHKMVQHIIYNVGGNIQYLKSFDDLNWTSKCKKVMQAVKFNGNLEIGLKCSIPIMIYTQVKQELFPNLLKESQKSYDRTNKGSGKVIMDRIYKRKSNMNEIFEKTSENTAKAYRYGEDRISFSTADELNMKFEAVKSCQLLAFLPRNMLDVSMFIWSTDLAIAPRTKPKAQEALSALIRGMDRENVAGIARIVFRKNSAPKVVCLIPFLQQEYDALLIQQLPFLEDQRHYIFGNLSSTFQNLTLDQKSVAASLVEKLTDYNSSIYDPQKSFNPALQRFYLSVQHRSRNNDCFIPRLPKTIERWNLPDPSFLDSAKSIIQNFKTSFPNLKKVVKKPKPNTTFWTNINEEKMERINQNKDAVKDKTEVSLPETRNDPKTVGKINPIYDFQNIIRTSIKNPNPKRLIDQAISGLKEQIRFFFQSSNSNKEYFRKAIQCIRYFQIRAIEIDRGNIYNEFLYELKENFPSNDYPEIWQALRDQEINFLQIDGNMS